MKKSLLSIILVLLIWGIIVGTGFMLGSFGGSVYVTFKMITRIML